MTLVMVRTFGLFFLTVIITLIWVLHKKRHTTFIKYKPKRAKRNSEI